MKLLKLFLVCTAIIFMVTLFFEEYNKLKSINYHANGALLFLSTLALVPLILFVANGWHLILKGMEVRLDAKKIIYIWLVSSVTRYIPGGIWSYASRLSMANHIGINYTASTKSLYIETILLAASSFTMGVPSLMHTVGYAITSIIILAFTILVYLFLHPDFFKLFKIFPGNIAQKLSVINLLPWRTTFRLYIYYMCYWISLGIIFSLFVHSVISIQFADILYIISCFSLAYMLGFVIIFIPGGIGVRESVLYFLLLPLYDPSFCLVISIGSRLWLILGEFISVLIIILINKNYLPWIKIIFKVK